MNIIGRPIALVTGGLMLASIAGTIAARVAKERIERIEDPDADEVRLTAFFEPMLFRSTAPAFRGGTVDVWYGGGVIDLREATLDPAGAHLQVRAIFGGAQILVPETWRVSTKVVGIGGIGDARLRVEHPADAPHLTIEGLAVLGGFGVMSEIPQAELRGLAQAVARSAARRHVAPTAEPLAASAV